MAATDPYYGRSLARIHHEGFSFHAEACAPGILELLRPVRERHGLVVELGCGSGLLTRHLVRAGHRVLATDASPAMLELAHEYAVGADGIAALVLPDDPVPPADAIVSVGHTLNYLPDADAIDRALVAIADALRPGGVLAIDLCDFEYGAHRREAPNLGRVADDWAIITQFSLPSRERFVRRITTFIRDGDGSWQRDDEQHENMLIDVNRVPPLLGSHGVRAEIGTSFGAETLPAGLCTIIGFRPV